jgi:hypothetical protein
MIYKNNEVYNLTDADKKKVFDFLGWENKNGKLTRPDKVRPAVIVHPESYYTYDNVNKRISKPALFNLPLEAIDYGEQGSEKWNYAEKPPIYDGNNKTYTYVSHMAMKSNFLLTIAQIDLLFFLITKSSFRELTDSEIASGMVQKNKPAFKVENREAEAMAKLQKDRNKTTIKNYINGDATVCWTIEKIRQNAIVFGLSGALDMGPFELKSALLGKLEGEPGAWERFWAQCSIGEETDYRYMIEVAKANKVLKYVEKDRKWYWLDDKGGKNGEICSHTSLTSKPEDDLLNHMKNDDATMLQIKSNSEYNFE